MVGEKIQSLLLHLCQKYNSIYFLVSIVISLSLDYLEGHSLTRSRKGADLMVNYYRSLFSLNWYQPMNRTPQTVIQQACWSVFSVSVTILYVRDTKVNKVNMVCCSIYHKFTRPTHISLFSFFYKRTENSVKWLAKRRYLFAAFPRSTNTIKSKSK